ILNRTADRLENELAPLTNDAVAGIRQHFSGAANESFTASMARFTTSEPRYIYAAANHLRWLATFSKRVGLQVQYTKLIIVLSAVELMGEFAAAAAFPALWNKVMAQTAVFRWLARTALRRLLLHVASTMMISQAFQLAMDLLAQRIQFHQGRRTEW